MQHRPTRKLTTSHKILLAILVVVLACGIAYGLGYRVGPHSLTRVGAVTLLNLPKGTSVFMDQSLQSTASKEGKLTIEGVPGEHQLIVGAPDDNPWSTAVSIISGKTVTLQPIFVKTKFTGTTIYGEDRTAALEAIAANVLPLKTSPLKVLGGCATVYLENNQIIEEAATSTPGCTPPPYLCSNGVCDPTIIYAPLAKLQAIAPFPHNPNAILILLDHTLLALGLDPRTPQFFAPVAQGKDLKMGVLKDGSVVVQDADTVSRVSL